MAKKKKNKNVIFGEEKQKNLMDSDPEMSRNVTEITNENYFGSFNHQNSDNHQNSEQNLH